MRFRASFRRVLAGSALTVGLVASSVTAAAAHETYTVERGDTLSGIARSLDGVSTWRELAEANADEIADPNLILVGQVLTIPSGSSADSASSSTAAVSSAPAPSSTGSVAVSTWDRLAQCESSGNWSINTGNGYYGGLQFSLPSWRWVGGRGYPHQATKAEQIARAEILLERQGWATGWPACSAKLGLR